MSERNELLAALADRIADYREGDLPKPTPDHVDKWLSQFDSDAQLPFARELNHVLERTYFSQAFVRDFFAHQITNEKLVGTDPKAFWNSAHFLDIQEHGHSQSEITKTFGEALKDKLGLEIGKCGTNEGPYFYLDDVIFTGGRVRNDLTKWIKSDAPDGATIHILVIATHRFGEWGGIESLKKAADIAKKKISLHCWAAVRIENRKTYRSQSEVLWPAELPKDKAVQDYADSEKRFPFEPRPLGGKLELGIFSSEEGRTVLEQQLLIAGVRIRGFCRDPSPILRPLGFSNFGLGFGSTVVTFRNCPNNDPLAFWWGDPAASPRHPFSKWYPLFPRKTYEKEVTFDDLIF